MYCPACGRPYEAGSLYCGGCGTRLPTSEGGQGAGGMYGNPYGPNGMPMGAQVKLGRREIAAVLLAFIPGFLNVFGLGHIVMKSYARGAAFLLISLIVWYLNGWSYIGSSFWLVMVDVLIYFYQAMDIMRVVTQAAVRR